MATVFLDANVILIHSVKVELPTGEAVEHIHYKRLESFFRVLAQALQKRGSEIISSLTVFNECEKKVDAVVEDSIGKTRKATEDYLDFLSLVKNKARKQLKDFLELVDKPSIDVKKRDEIIKKKVLPLHTSLIADNKLPMSRRWSDNDIKILADATHLLEKNNYQKLCFCTTETCLVYGKRTSQRGTKTIPIQREIYSTLGFNTYYPTEIISLL